MTLFIILTADDWITLAVIALLFCMAAAAAAFHFYCLGHKHGYTECREDEEFLRPKLRNYKRYLDEQ